MKEASIYKYNSKKKIYFKSLLKAQKFLIILLLMKKETVYMFLIVLDFNEKGIGVYKFDLDTGNGGPCSNELFNFANGMCLSPNNNYMYVVESFHPCISRIPINDRWKFWKKRNFY